MKNVLLLLLSSIPAAFLSAQSVSPGTDSTDTKTLQEVLVRAYEQNRKLSDVPVSVSVLSARDLGRYPGTSIVSAVNSVPGVRMEERSPGSYRLSFRGSTLRSPFGVRNVKVYLDGIPFTDPGGNTYLNQLALANIQSLELIKGPGGSLYGAGTGGALLIGTENTSWQPGASVDYTYGSFNTNLISAQVRLGQDDSRNIVTYSHQTADGYRANTALRRDIASWETTLAHSEKRVFKGFFSYGDLYYQTPGALTLAEYSADPKQARPKAGAFPSAQTAQAGIFQKTFLAAITQTYTFNEHWQHTASVYGAYTQLKNPTFRNYEIRNEPHFGGRTSFTYHQNLGASVLKVDAGFEGQYGFFRTEDYGNNTGKPDTIQTSDNVNVWTYAVFAQADLRLPGGWGFTAGASYNRSRLSVDRLTVPGFIPEGNDHASFAPRVSADKKIGKNLLLFASVARGFSPPTVAEVLPSGSINTGLKPEEGINYETGLKTGWFGNRLYLEATAFYFRLKNAIVVRKDAGGADFYTNAGATRQRGIESQLSWQAVSRPDGMLTGLRPWISYTLNDFTYRDFLKNAVTFSGKKLPGTAVNTVAAGIDANFHFGLYANLTYYYSDRIALDDANANYASAYQLLGGRIGLRTTPRSGGIGWDFFVGADNLNNAKYSLGNDINAAGGRFYNPAPTANYFIGASIRFLAKRKNN